MSTVRCNYIGCSKNISSATFFRFPVKDKNRCQKWILHSGNIELLDMDEKKLRDRRICQDHFDERAVTNNARNRLIKTALPIHFQEHEDTFVRGSSTGIRTYSAKKRKIVANPEHSDLSSGEELSIPPLEKKFILEAPLLEEENKQPALRENKTKQRNKRLLKLQKENKQLKALLTRKNDKLRICQQQLRRMKSKMSGLSLYTQG